MHKSNIPKLDEFQLKKCGRAGWHLGGYYYNFRGMSFYSQSTSVNLSLLKLKCLLLGFTHFVTT